MDRYFLEPFYQDDSDFTTNSESYYRYLARRNAFLKLVEETQNRLLRRNLIIKNTPSVLLSLDGKWVGDTIKDTLTLEANVKKSTDTISDHLVSTENKNFNLKNSLHEKNNGLWTPDYIEMIKELDRTVMNMSNKIVVSNEIELQQALDYLVDGGTVQIKQGVKFEIENVIIRNSGIVIDGNNATVTSKTEGKMFTLLENVSTITFKNLNFISTFHTSAHNFIYGQLNKTIIIKDCHFTGGYFHVNFTKIKQLTVENCESRDFYGFCYNVYGADGLHYLNNHIYNGINYDGLKISGTEAGTEITTNSNINILNNHVHHCKGDGIDIATNDGRNIIIENNNCHDNEAYGIQFKIVYQTNEGLKDSVISNNILKENKSGGISIQSPTGNTPLENIVIENNVISSLGNTLTGTAIRLYNVITGKVKGNITNGYQFGIRGIESNSTFFERNDILNTRYGIQIEVQISGQQARNNILSQNRITNFISGGINIVGLACIKTIISDNIFRNEMQDAYSIIETATDTASYNNIVGYLPSVPTNKKATKGDIVINTSIEEGSPIKWIAMTTGSIPVWKGIEML